MTERRQDSHDILGVTMVGQQSTVVVSTVSPNAATVAAASVIVDSGAILNTASGDVRLSAVLLAVAPPHGALLGLRALRFAGLGQTDYPFGTDAVGLLPDEVRLAYASSVSGLTSQVGSMPSLAADRIGLHHG